MIQTIRRTNPLPDLVYETIYESIHSGRIKPGAPLQQNTLAEALNVSPRTVREAFKKLVADGLAIYEPRKGVKAIVLTPDDRVDMLEMRARLEEIAIEHAVDNLTAQDIAKMRELLPFTSTHEIALIPEARQKNQEFHWIIIQASRSPQLIRVLEQIWRLSVTYYRYHELSQDRLQKEKLDLLETHGKLITALEEKDPRRACEINSAHIRGLKKVIRAEDPNDVFN